MPGLATVKEEVAYLSPLGIHLYTCGFGRIPDFGLQQICSLTNVNGRNLDRAFVNDENSVEFIEPPTAILKTDQHHKAFVLKAIFHAGGNESSPLPGSEPDSDYVDWDTLLRDQVTNGSTELFYDVVHRSISVLSCLPKVFDLLIHKGMYSAAQTSPY